MASTTIHTLSYKMVADTQQFTRGLIQSKSEVTMLKKIMGDTTPEQKTEKALASLQRLYEAGKISQTQYKDATAKVRAELEALSRSSKTTGGGFEKINSGLKGFVGAFISMQAASRGMALFNDTLKKLDDQQDNAERFGIFVDDFIRMQYALERGGDIGRGNAAEALKTMRDNIELAAMDMGKFKELFGQYADRWTILSISLQPIGKQFESMINIINQIPDAGERGLLTAKLFGTDAGQMASLIAGGSEGLDKLYRQAAEFRLLQGNDAKKIENVAERWKDVSYQWEGVVNHLTVALLPVAEKLAFYAERIFGPGPQILQAPKNPAVNTGQFILEQTARMAAMEQTGTIKVRDNKGVNTYIKRGKLDQSQLIDFFQQARQLDPNFAEASLSPEQSRRLYRSAIPGDPGGTQQQVQLLILEELKRQTKASEDLLREQQDRLTKDQGGLIN